MRHTIGWLNRPTRDRRVLRDIKFRNQVPVLKGQWGGELQGIAADFRIDPVDGSISCETTATLQPDEVLSMSLGDARVDWPHGDESLSEMSGGTLVGMYVIPVETWAWETGVD